MHATKIQHSKQNLKANSTIIMTKLDTQSIAEQIISYSSNNMGYE